LFVGIALLCLFEVIALRADPLVSVFTSRGLPGRRDTLTRVTRRMNSAHIGHSFGIPAHLNAEVKKARYTGDPAHFLDNPQVGFYRDCTVFRHRRSDASRLALETLVPHERAYRRSLADEVAIDFPSSRAAIELFRRDHVDADVSSPAAHAEIRISAWQAYTGALVSMDVAVPRTCGCCGGRGEVWGEPCEPCDEKGQEIQAQRLTVSVPAGVVDGDRFSFNLSLPRGPRTRVDVRVAVIAHLR
jgi:hypothetical protein